ncbi:probable RNA polymerase II nuclear localization protein SLC7A6OS [Argiope bruennichi]|uniref:Probable RNA polymerase II nuclear localization protein SLC7A6OS n=1 Tax=Argiope bruennichi TaxID=94029 RepID=A0A8T0EMK1_ARGBR|nr:probable RNA polymerase II nuclear localization protein SLC7A6OS [Argiope bruennichi]KAF8774654.1 putative RNA polymerase II nuclear like protein [Argiope bruennichi]
MSVVLRLKRKACNEPVEGLVVALKRSKFDETSNTNEVFFKFAATLKSETESVKDHIQAVLSKDKAQRFSKWRDPKSVVSSQKNVHSLYEKLRRENKAASEKKKLDLLNNRRLILSETVPIEEDVNITPENAEVRKLFQLYDIIEESEDVKKQAEEAESNITCNDQPLVREKSGDYVYDVYIANGQIDNSFVENPISVRPCTMTEDDIYSGDSDNDGECYEDEDDSNDENNWRNEYPEDESSNSESDQGSDEYESEEYDPYCQPGIRNLRIDDECEDDYCHDSDDEDDGDYDRSKILMELNDSSD